MGDRAARIATMIGVFPIAAALYACIYEFTWYPGTRYIERQYACSLTVAFLAAVMPLLWRRYVNVNILGRLTIWLGLFGVVSYAANFESWIIYASSRGADVVAAESFGLLGTWLVIASLIWWPNRRIVGKESPLQRVRTSAMSAATKRLVIGIGLALLLPCFWLIVENWLNRDLRFSSERSMVISVTLAVSIGVATWISIWRKSVAWNPPRVAMTIALAAMWMATSTVPYMSSPTYTVKLLLDSSPFWMGGLWIIGTAWLWKSKSQRSSFVTEYPDGTLSPKCLHCGYSLRGLTEVRCPECGWSGTIDAVLSAALVDDV